METMILHQRTWPAQGLHLGPLAGKSDTVATELYGNDGVLVETNLPFLEKGTGVILFKQHIHREFSLTFANLHMKTRNNLKEKRKCKLRKGSKKEQMRKG